jgi:hypothetical protein
LPACQRGASRCARPRLSRERTTLSATSRRCSEAMRAGLPAVRVLRSAGLLAFAPHEAFAAPGLISRALFVPRRERRVGSIPTVSTFGSSKPNHADPSGGTLGARSSSSSRQATASSRVRPRPHSLHGPLRPCTHEGAVGDDVQRVAQIVGHRSSCCSDPARIGLHGAFEVGVIEVAVDPERCVEVGVTERSPRRGGAPSRTCAAPGACSAWT